MTLAARGLGYAVDGRELLRGVDLELWHGEVHALLGRNGAGKSTLLRLLAGELKPGSGTVMLNGCELHRWSPRQRALQRAVLPQGESLRFGFSAGQVVALGRYAAPKQRPEVEQRIVREALAFAGAGALEQRRSPSLSGGERARVQFARALAQVWEPPAGVPALHGVPRYLLLDEPTASLDLAHQHHCLAQARAFAGRGVGVLAALHDPNLALRYADRVTVLEQGRVIGQGPVREVLTRALLERLYGISIELLQTAEGAPIVVAHP